MATIIGIAGNSQLGSRVVSAASALRDGLGTLRELDGLRANAIGVSQAEMQSIFGASSTGDAQALNDRWAALLYAVFNEGSPDYDSYVYLRDFMDGIAVDTA
jgi:hypothetical protein